MRKTDAELLMRLFEETDTRKKDFIGILKKIPYYHSSLIMLFQRYATNLKEMKTKYDVTKKARLDYYISPTTDMDIFSLFKTKEDRDLYVNNSIDDLVEINNEIQKIKSDVDMIENAIRYLSETNRTVRTILEYEKFRAGK